MQWRIPAFFNGFIFSRSWISQLILLVFPTDVGSEDMVVLPSGLVIITSVSTHARARAQGPRGERHAVYEAQGLVPHRVLVSQAAH